MKSWLLWVAVAAFALAGFFLLWSLRAQQRRADPVVVSATAPRQAPDVPIPRHRPATDPSDAELDEAYAAATTHARRGWVKCPLPPGAQIVTDGLPWATVAGGALWMAPLERSGALQLVAREVVGTPGAGDDAGTSPEAPALGGVRWRGAAPGVRGGCTATQPGDAPQVQAAVGDAAKAREDGAASLRQALDDPDLSGAARHHIASWLEAEAAVP